MVTLKDIAEKAGVTVSVVSRALNPRPDKHARVAPDTKAKIEAVSRELGFRRNRGAEFLKRGKSPVIQVYLPPRTSTLVAELMYGMAEAAEQEDFSLSFSYGSCSDSYVRFLTGAVQNRSCGVLSHHHYLEPGFWTGLNPDMVSSIRMVSLNPRETLPAGFCSVSLGYREAGEMAAKRLVERGCASLAVIGRAPLRTNGFMAAAQTALKSAVSFTPSDLDNLIAWIRDAPRPVGIFALNDILAMKVIHRLSGEHIRIPDEVRVIGHDNQDFAPHVNPPLTTIRQEYREEGRESLRMLVRLIYGETVQSKTISPTLVSRESA
jgi:DNA-binding LacI/PurR family transcriptional regulator